MANAIMQSQKLEDAKAKLNELEYILQNYRALYENYSRHSAEAEQIGDLPDVRTRVIERAIPPLEKSKPKSTLVLALAGMFGVLMGIGIGILAGIFPTVFFALTEKLKSDYHMSASRLFRS